MDSGTPEVGQRCLAQVRAHGDQLPATIEQASDGGPLVVSLEGTFRGVAPGQSLVLYDDTRVIGSGTITNVAQGPGSRLVRALKACSGGACA